MKTSGRCPKCSSKKVIVDATPIGGELNGLFVSIFRDPSALIFKKRRMSALSACVCGSCGYVEFYAKSLHLLVEEEQPHSIVEGTPAPRPSS